MTRVPHPYDKNKDFVVAFRPNYEKGSNRILGHKLITAWVNDKNDPHWTLGGETYTHKDQYIPDKFNNPIYYNNKEKEEVLNKYYN